MTRRRGITIGAGVAVLAATFVALFQPSPDPGFETAASAADTLGSAFVVDTTGARRVVAAPDVGEPGAGASDPVMPGEAADTLPVADWEPDAGVGSVPIVAGESGLVVPVAGVSADALIDTYTAARSGGRSHDAIDIMAPRGTPVVATTGGRILKLFESDRGGITIYQIGDDGRTVYYYAHLDRYADGLRENDRVERGEVIGYVGNTGNAGPDNYHLHFAVWVVDDPDHFWDGAEVNPYPLLGGR